MSQRVLRSDVQSQYYVTALELTDVVQRRCASLPNLYIGISIQLASQNSIMNNRPSGAKWYAEHVVTPRPDLVCTTAFPTRETAKSAMRRYVSKLSEIGFTVNRNTTVWSVYVIELDASAAPTPGYGYLYVGETTKNHEQRFSEHMSRARNAKTRLYSSVVARYGLRLRPDLAPPNLLFSKKQSLKAEKEWANNLRKRGFTVEGGH